MGLTATIGKLLSFTRVERNGAKLSDVKVDLGGGEDLTGEHLHGPGDDAVPLPGDQIVAVPVAQTGRVVIVGYIETDATQKATAGDRRMYARDSERLEVAEVWVKSDGSVTVSNANGSYLLRPDGSHRLENPEGSIELLANGTINLNGVTIDPSGNVVIPTSLDLNGKEIAEHDHSQANDSGGNTEQDTGPNN